VTIFPLFASEIEWDESQCSNVSRRSVLSALLSPRGCC